MISYTMVGVKDIKKAGKFYDPLLSALGAKRTWDTEKFIVWGTGEGASFCITLPHDNNPATVGNGSMIALGAKDPQEVDKLYNIAIAAGATDEGAPGLRGPEESGFYAGYFRDIDGNKLNAFSHNPA